MNPAETHHFLLDVAQLLRSMSNACTPAERDRLQTMAWKLDAHRQNHAQLAMDLERYRNEAGAAERWIHRRQLREQLTAAALTGFLARGQVGAFQCADLAVEVGQRVQGLLAEDSRA